MYIKSVVIDGYKSYGKRIEIAGFDKLFNAITGLNGSGKSNILDAICFVLGLNNMALARCANLRELIYKQGQAGVHKAVVTVVFDNTDKESSPSGYDHLSEIVIRREVHLNSRTKYYVCGQTASNSQVSDLFHSCQLNISNPHFLIMQGRITKVLNMKPREILAMIEETTGVALYNAKKRDTQTIIEKKETHLRSIDGLINETIMPRLDQLRKEHAVLLDYQNLVGELEKISRQYVAWQFVQHQRKADHASEMTDDCNKKVKLYQDDILQLEQKQEEISQKVAEIERYNDELSGGQIAELEEALKEEERIEIKETGRLEKLTDSLNEERKKKKDVEKLLAKDEQLKQKKQQEYDSIRRDFDKVEEDYNNANLNHEKAQKNYEAVTAGKALNEEGDVATSLADQLIKAEEEYNSSNTEMKIAKTKLVNCKRDLNEKKSQATKHKAQYDEDNKHIANLEDNVTSIKKRLDTLEYDDDHYARLQQEMSSAHGRLKELNQQMSGEETSARLNFEYAPIKDFDPKCVHGYICNLFTLKDPKYARAVEAAGGGGLYNIVVDTNDQARTILDQGKLKRRYNFCALNKVTGRQVIRSEVDAAKKFASDQDVHAVIDLIEFDPRVRAAMENVFGDTFVAPNVDKAMKITYSNLRKKTVTLDGDVVMPGGDMSGGAVSRQESFLVSLVKHKQKLEEKSQLERSLYDLRTQLASLEEKRRAFLSLEAEHKHHSSKLEVVRNRLQLTSEHHKLFESVKQLEREVAALEQKLMELQDLSDRSHARANELRTKLKNKEQSHKKELEAAEKALVQAKKETDAKKKLIDQRKGRVESLRLEIEDLVKSCEQYRETIDRLATVIEEKQNEVQQQGEVVEQVKGEVKVVADKLKEQKSKLREQNDEINKLSKKRDRMGSEINEKRLEIKKIQHRVEQINSEAGEASQAVKSMLRKYEWIAQEKHLFGKDNSDYPFNRKDFNINELSNRVQKLTNSKNALQKTVNQRANMLLGDKEKEAEQLNKRRDVIEKDKDKLIKYMDEIDKQKKDTLHKAWKIINIDFNGIFSTFLPNSGAKLDLIPGKDLLEGLEVKVSFGGVWKESLTELSGGQRSLVALSLTLALCKYKPAPLYILDEVDAALDQNHTQNTGTMIKKHFNNSQFIIVSLKDDMFRNANVLFKTRFVDGKSDVTRYTHSSAA